MKKQEKNLNKNIILPNNAKGITLIALVIIIIILIILAGVTISITLGENGILNKAKNVADTNNKAMFEEQVKLAVATSRTNNTGNIDTNILEEEINKIKDATITKSENDKLPWIVTKDKYTITIDGEEIVQETGSDDEKIVDIFITSDNRAMIGYTDTTTNLIIPEEFESDGVKYRVTGIEKEAFKACTNIQTISIPNSIKIIGEGAFYGCSNLNSIDIPDGVIEVKARAFFECIGVTDIKLGKNVTSIGKGAFSNPYNWKNSKLESISVDTENPKYESLDGVLYTKGKKTLIQYPYKKIQDTFSVPEETTTIGFAGLAGTKIENIKMNNITKLCEVSLRETSELNSISNNQKIEIIKKGSFYKSALKSIVLDNVKEIESAFIQSNLQSVEIKSTNIIKAGDAFYKSKGLETVVLPSGLNEIYAGMFGSCENLKTINIPDTIKYIRKSAFRDCSSSLELTLPEGLVRNRIIFIRLLYCKKDTNYRYRGRR